MKFALVLLVVLPMVYTANIDQKRFLENLLGGIDVLDLAKQLICQFGTDETEQDCEDTMCPEVLDLSPIDIPHLFADPLCALVCEEVQVITNTFICHDK